MEPFHEAVCLRMGCRGPVQLDAEEVGEGRPEVGRELRSSVGGHVAWDPEASDPVTGECSGAGLGVDGGQRDGLWPSGEPVNYGEQVGVPLGRRKRSNKVDVDMVKPMWRDSERLQGGLDMAVHLGALAV